MQIFPNFPICIPKYLFWPYQQIELKAYILDTVKSATLLTPPILSPNKKKNARRPSPNRVSLNTRRRPRRKQSNSATPLLFARARVKENVKPFMNRSVKLDTMSTRSKMMSSNAKKLSKRNAFPRLKVMFSPFLALFWPFFGPFLALFWLFFGPFWQQLL